LLEDPRDPLVEHVIVHALLLHVAIHIIVLCDIEVENPACRRWKPSRCAASDCSWSRRCRSFDDQRLDLFGMVGLERGGVAPEDLGSHSVSTAPQLAS
jgi:hypothetical protein